MISRKPLSRVILLLALLGGSSACESPRYRRAHLFVNTLETGAKLVLTPTSFSVRLGCFASGYMACPTVYLVEQITHDKGQLKTDVTVVDISCEDAIRDGGWPPGAGGQTVGTKTLALSLDNGKRPYRLTFSINPSGDLEAHGKSTPASVNAEDGVRLSIRIYDVNNSLLCEDSLDNLFPPVTICRLHSANVTTKEMPEIAIEIVDRYFYHALLYSPKAKEWQDAFASVEPLFRNINNVKDCEEIRARLRAKVK